MTREMTTRTDRDVAAHTSWLLHSLHPHYQLHENTLAMLMNSDQLLEAVNKRGHAVEDCTENIKETYRRIVDSAISTFGVEILPVSHQIEGQNG